MGKRALLFSSKSLKRSEYLIFDLCLKNKIDMVTNATTIIAIVLYLAMEDTFVITLAVLEWCPIESKTGDKFVI